MKFILYTGKGVIANSNNTSDKLSLCLTNDIAKASKFHTIGAAMRKAVEINDRLCSPACKVMSIE